MKNPILENKKIDPSDNKQLFCCLNLNVHCCRYWLLEEWECNNMSFPFWRLYYNSSGQAKVMYKNSISELDSKSIILIPPNTSFNSSLKNHFSNNKTESIVGSKITSEFVNSSAGKKELTKHFFIHFNLGFKLDHIVPDIYEFGINQDLMKIINEIKTSIMNNESDCNLKTSLQIHLLIFNLLNSLDPSIFKNKQLDQRIYSVLMYIDQHIDQPLDNSILAGIANMATNSFARLFAENQNISLQNFIQKRRIENACNLLHHTDLNIDQISDLCGFSDRSHFSKIFKKQLQITPGYYKKVYSQKLTSI